LERLHNLGLYHSNLKPTKIVIGAAGEEDKLYIVGFENSLNIKDNTNKKSIYYSNHILNIENVFSSIGIHLGESKLDII